MSRIQETDPPGKPALPWPPPRLVRRALVAASRRLHALPRFELPADLHAILTAAEGRLLATLGYWPLPAPARAWLAEPPAERARRRKRWERRIRAVVLDILAAELPGAVAVVLRRTAS
jgi:hypothetical protein